MDSQGSVERKSYILALVSFHIFHYGYKMLQAARSQAFAAHSDQCGGGIPSLGEAAKHEKTWALKPSKRFHMVPQFTLLTRSSFYS